MFAQCIKGDTQADECQKSKKANAYLPYHSLNADTYLEQNEGSLGTVPGTARSIIITSHDSWCTGR